MENVVIPQWHRDMTTFKFTLIVLFKPLKAQDIRAISNTVRDLVFLKLLSLMRNDHYND